LGLAIAGTVSACSTVTTPNAPAQEEGGVAGDTVSVLVGYRELESDNEPVDEQTPFGIEFSRVEPTGWGWDVAFSYSEEDDDAIVLGFPVDVELTILELSGGARYTFDTEGPLRPYVGGGASFLDLDLEVDTMLGDADDDETDFGLYVRTGVAYPIGDNFSVGVDLRTLFATGEDVDYWQAAATAGWTL
jgi:opacity protein-like surface antigen